MANDLFGGLGGALGGLVGGLANSGLVPKDTPEGKLFAAQSELSGLQKQEADILAEIGRQAYGQNPDAWPQSDKLKLIQSNIASVQAKLNAAKAEKQAKEQAEKEEKAACTCPSCGHENPEGVKFCQECGTKLGGSAKKHCTSCGAELTPGTLFCGECGARQPE